MTMRCCAGHLALLLVITAAACRASGDARHDGGGGGSGATGSGGSGAGGSGSGGSGPGGSGTGGSGGTGGATPGDASVTDARDSGPLDDAAPTDASASSCEGVDGGTNARPRYLDMRISGAGFEAHEGRSVFLFTRGSNSGVLGVGRATVVGGAFVLDLPKGYLRAGTQEIYWLIDTDGDGLCNEAAGDHAGYVAAAGFDPPGDETFATTITDNHVRMTPRYPDLCTAAKAFGEMNDFNITGSGFAAHEGRRIHLLTRTVVNGAIFASGTATVVSGGFSFAFPKAFESFTYQELFWYVDEDGDGRCTSAGDHTGYVVTPAFTPVGNTPVTMPITDNHMSRSGRGADVCVVMNGCQLAP